MGEMLRGRRAMVALAALCAGCGLGGPKPLEPASFLAPPPAQPSAVSSDIRTDARRVPNDDAPGALPDMKTSVDPADSGGILTVPGQPAPVKEVTGVSDTVRENVRTSADIASQRSAENGAKLPTATTLTTGPALGEYMTLGAVVVTVNGNPIYANKVISDIAPVLAVKARELEPDDFQRVAQDEVQKQLQVLVRTELEFAAAQRNLDDHDRKLDDAMAAAADYPGGRIAGASPVACPGRRAGF